jgi:hypothetical protein
MKGFVVATLLVAGVSDAQVVCQWKDAKGVTQFSNTCPTDIEVEQRWRAAPIDYGATPEPSLLIEQANRIKAKNAAEAAQLQQRRAIQAEDEYVEKMRRMAKGNGKGLNQTWSEAEVDAQHRRFATDELDRIERRRAGLPPKSEVERRVERLERKVDRDRRRNILQQDALRQKQIQQDFNR